MNLTNEFCCKRLEVGVPKVLYVKQAAECLGQQPELRVWVLNENIHLNEVGESIPVSHSEYIWLCPKLSGRTLANVAPSSDAASVPMRSLPLNAFEVTLKSLKTAVDNNFLPAFFVIASACMALHYELVMEKYGMCPAPVVIGFKNTGKRTAA